MTALAVAPVRIPACMTADELALWQAGNGVATGTKNGQRVYAGRAGSPCDDCTLGYAADMRAEGRCDGTPGGVEEDDVEFVTPAEFVSGVVEARVKTKALVTIVAPCATCIHVRVCRLQPADELVVTADLPDIADELAFTLTATVECSEYARAPKAKARPTATGRAPESARKWNGGPLQSEAQRAARAANVAKAREARAKKYAAFPFGSPAPEVPA